MLLLPLIALIGCKHSVSTDRDETELPAEYRGSWVSTEDSETIAIESIPSVRKISSNCRVHSLGLFEMSPGRRLKLDGPTGDFFVRTSWSSGFMPSKNVRTER